MIDRRNEIIEAVNRWRDESVNVNRWGYRAEAHVSNIVELYDNMITDEIRKAKKPNWIVPVYFANVAFLVSATTRDFEPLNEDEIEAYKKLMADVWSLYMEYMEKGFESKLYFKIFRVRELIRLNAQYREDYDCKYRTSMIFKSHIDMYELIHKLIVNWDSLNDSEEFARTFNTYTKEWEMCSEKKDETEKFRALLDKYIE